VKEKMKKKSSEHPILGKEKERNRCLANILAGLKSMIFSYFTGVFFHSSVSTPYMFVYPLWLE